MEATSHKKLTILIGNDFCPEIPNNPRDLRSVMLSSGVSSAFNA